MNKTLKKLRLGFVLIIAVLVGVGLSHPVKAAVGDTIKETFPDTNFAQAIADKVASGNVNAEFTQTMVDNTTKIEFRSVNISDITGIENFINLTRVDLSRNNITQLPEGFDTLDNLEYLELGSNKFNIVPDKLCNLKNLKRLEFAGNNLTSVSDKIGNLTTLVELKLSENKITKLPSSIGNLTKLTHIYMTDNNLTSLPNSITNLSSLQFLVVSRNQITSLPVNFGQLSNLVGVSLEDNQLSYLPESFGDLSNLILLYLDNNQLTSLPLGMGNFTKLEAFAVKGNLLPTNYNDTLNTIGLSLVVPYEEQLQLVLKLGLNPYEIKNANDLNNINLLSTVALEASNISPSHKFILENYVDEKGTAVDINDFILNGKVIEDGTLFAQVRATGTGLFPNNSDHAITADKIQLDFKVSYNLSFNLNGGEGAVPATQSLLEGAMVARAVDNPVRKGYEFKGWNTTKDGSGQTWNFKTTTMPANDVTLYAQWKDNTKKVVKPPIMKPLPKVGDSINMIAFSGLILITASTLLVLNNRRKDKHN